MKLIKAEEACAQTEQIIAEENKKWRIKAEEYIDTHVYPAIKKQIANGCYYATLNGEFAALDMDTRKWVRTILSEYHYKACLKNELTVLDISWCKF